MDAGFVISHSVVLFVCSAEGHNHKESDMVFERGSVVASAVKVREGVPVDVEDLRPVSDRAVKVLE